MSRQRIKYMVEFGGIYPADEPASKNFVLKWLAILMIAQLAIEYLIVH